MGSALCVWQRQHSDPVARRARPMDVGLGMGVVALMVAPTVAWNIDDQDGSPIRLDFIDDEPAAVASPVKRHKPGSPIPLDFIDDEPAAVASSVKRHKPSNGSDSTNLGGNAAKAGTPSMEGRRVDSRSTVHLKQANFNAEGSKDQLL